MSMLLFVWLEIQGGMFFPDIRPVVLSMFQFVFELVANQIVRLDSFDMLLQHQNIAHLLYR